MKLNTNISLENIVTIIALICSVTLAFGFMKYDVDLLKKELELKADKRQVVADRELIAYKLDVIMQRNSLGTPLMDNFQIMLDEEFKKVNSFENLENTLLKVGGRVGNLMDVVQEAMDPESPLGKDLSKKEKDLISKSIIELEEKIAKLKMSIK